MGRKKPGYEYPCRGQHHADEQALGEEFADLFDPPFAGAARDQGLQAVVEPPADDCKQQIVDAGDTGG